MIWYNVNYNKNAIRYIETQTLGLLSTENLLSVMNVETYLKHFSHKSI